MLSKITLNNVIFKFNLNVFLLNKTYKAAGGVF